MLEKLEGITVVDPACGSGAYLLGMLHELVELQRLLYNSNLIAGARELYDLKLRVIQKNVYGVDIDAFAVNIAMLRLWLSLAVEYEGANPPPLPNLDYKIEVGDSVTTRGLLQIGMGDVLLPAYRAAKAAYMRAYGEEKNGLRSEIKRLRVEVSALAGLPVSAEPRFDWAVDFAEVFANGGFDVVLANPPYVRQELITAIKPALRAVYGDLYSGTADLYVFFYYRALQLLKQHGMLVFISSNKWFRANYGAKLRAHIAATCHVHSITDFGDLPVFESATAYPMIFIAQKGGAAGATLLTEVPSLEPPYPDVLAIIRHGGQHLPSEAINGENWMLTNTNIAARFRKMSTVGVPLGDYAHVPIYRGIVTGLNPAFVISGEKRAELIAQDSNSAHLIKPLVVGKDVRRWSVDYEDRWLIFARRGIIINDYPAIKEHLAQWQAKLEPKPRDWPKGENWPGRKPGSYKWYEIQDEIAYYATFDQPKIIFPDIALRTRFAVDLEGAYAANTCYFIPIDDLYLLSVLNSAPIESFYLELSAQVRGGYMRFFRQYVEQIPIPNVSISDRVAIADLAQKCLHAKGRGPEVAMWEAEIDARVARLYGLTEADVAAMAGAQAASADEDDDESEEAIG